MHTPDPQPHKSQKSKTEIFFKRLWHHYTSLRGWDLFLVTVFFIALLAIFISRIWIAIEPGGYILPHNANDWAAWGTWVGGLATTAAFIYTAFQIREQRTNRLADESKSLALQKLKAEHISPILRATKNQRTFVAHPTEDSQVNSQFNGTMYVLKFKNEYEKPIFKCFLELSHPFALPPLKTAARPKWSDGPAKGIEIDTSLDVNSFPQKVKPANTYGGSAFGLEIEILTPGEDLTLKLAFRKPGKQPSVIGTVFTDSSGFTWHRNLESGITTQILSTDN